jgi:hypothetical protein
MDMVTVFCEGDCCPDSDLGSRSFTTLGLTTADANRKNSIRKNMMSFNAEV